MYKYDLRKKIFWVVLRAVYVYVPRADGAKASRRQENNVFVVHGYVNVVGLGGRGRGVVGYGL